MYNSQAALMRCYTDSFTTSCVYQKGLHLLLFSVTDLLYVNVNYHLYNWNVKNFIHLR